MSPAHPPQRPATVDPALIERAIAAGPVQPPLQLLPGINPRPSAVALPLSFDPLVAYVVVRASALRDHADELGFPGGKPEAGDVDLRATALRELEEEVGLRDPRVLGELTPVPVITGRYMIHPFVVALEQGDEPRAASAEIAAVAPIALEPYLFGGQKLEGVKGVWQGQELIAPHLYVSLGGARRVLYGASAVVLVDLMARVARACGLEAPGIELVEKLPWGDRYREILEQRSDE